jgi:hypothetical protein
MSSLAILAIKTALQVTSELPSIGSAQPPSFLPRLKNGKVIGVVDEDALEEPRCQQAIKLCDRRVLLAGYGCEERYVGQSDGANLYVLRCQSRK